MDEEAIGAQVIDAAMRVHSVLGPGLLETIYEAALAVEMRKRGLRVEQQEPLSVSYDGVDLGLGLRLDLLIEGKVVVELKSVDEIHPVFLKQTLSYLKIGGYHLGFLFNFNIPRLKDGIKRIVNDLPSARFDPPSRSSRPSRDSFDSDTSHA